VEPRAKMALPLDDEKMNESLMTEESKENESKNQNKELPAYITASLSTGYNHYLHLLPSSYTP
jgi:hypothetical protein